eukprot:5512243-Lingulodinium_polyedra.AAC.1
MGAEPASVDGPAASSPPVVESPAPTGAVGSSVFTAKSSPSTTKVVPGLSSSFFCATRDRTTEDGSSASRRGFATTSDSG